jgi:predicted dehydrogenase
MKTFKIGIVGWGFMGRTHAHAVRSLGLFYPEAGFRAEIAGVCSRRLEKAREGAAELGAPFYTDDYRALFARDDVDVVSICAPNENHEEIAIEAMRAGKRVYIDKPLSISAESADKIADVARETGAFTRMVFNNRYLPSMMRAKQLADEGKIGNLLSFQARYLHSGSIDPNKPAGWKQTAQGGVLLDLGSHALDLITWLCGYPASVSAAERTLYPERPVQGGGTTRALSEDMSLVVMRMKNGALGTIEASKIATGANDELTVEVRGDRGAILWDLMRPNYVRFFDNTLGEAPLGGTRGFVDIESVARYPAPGGSFLPPKNTIGWDRGHIHCYFTFLDALNRGIRPENGIEEGARLQRLLTRIRQAAEKGVWVDTSDV